MDERLAVISFPYFPFLMNLYSSASIFAVNSSISFLEIRLEWLFLFSSMDTYLTFERKLPMKLYAFR